MKACFYFPVPGILYSCDTCGKENVMLVFYLMKVVIYIYFWDQVSFFFLINQNVVEQGTQ